MNTITQMSPSCFVTLETHSEWDGNAEFQVTVRKIKKSDKIIVDVTEIFSEPATKKAIEVARQRVRKFGVVSVDASILSDFTIEKKINGGNDLSRAVKIRRSSYVFQAV